MTTSLTADAAVAPAATAASYSASVAYAVPRKKTAFVGGAGAAAGAPAAGAAGASMARARTTRRVGRAERAARMVEGGER